MPSSREPLLCEYRYDPLDRLVSHKQQNTPIQQRFYSESLLATEIQGAVQRSVMQYGNLLLGEKLNQEDGFAISILATDQRRSVMHALTPPIKQTFTYSPYGFCIESGLTSLLGFNGERSDPVTEHYLLGNGYRAFNPILMRFNSPDSWSPFGKGGLNSYVYCLSDPINLIDQNGHNPLKSMKSFFKKLTKSKRSVNSPSIRQAPSFNNSPPARRHSSPSLLPASPSDDQLTEWDLIGYHGTSSNYSDSLTAGLDPTFMGKSTNMLLGEGFYFGTRDIAELFSYRVANPNGSWRSRFGQPIVHGVYVENFSRLKPGEDYLFSRSINISGINANGKLRTINYREIVAKEHTYNNLTIRGTDFKRRVTSPRSYESPLSSKAAANVEGVRSLFFNKSFHQ
jgi:RHS repeat-associated protein